MADIQKPAEAPVAAPVVAEPVGLTHAEPVVGQEATPAAAEATTTSAEAAAPAEAAKKEEVVPVEEGHLEHKGSNFPKNFIYSKKYFWFGSEPVESKSLGSYLRTEKATDVAHHVASWASQTGKGLLFVGEKDKTNPSSVIQLSEASEPTAEGSNKFHLTSKGHKHTFKTTNATERDNWVSQLKLKIAEAKELAATIPETDAYKKTRETLKPTPVKKEEKPVVAPEAKAVDTPAAEAEAETPKEETKKEETKRRSASRKRASVFGGLFGKKDEEKKAETATEPAAEATETAVPAAEEPAATTVATEAPATTTPEVVAAPVTEPTTEPAAPVTETAPVEAAKVESKDAKPATPKRNSIFGGLPFGKKKTPAAEPAAPAPAAPAADAAPVAETAPVIPAVETTAPLSAEVNSPATVPTETTEVAAPTNGETKKEVRSDKRKSSLPFVTFGKKDKATTSDEEADKPKSPSPFSKLRATIKGKGKTEKPAEKAAEPEAAKETAPATSEPAAASKPADTPATLEPEAQPAEKPLAATPAVAATA